MSVFLSLAYLFFIGSVLGWVVELVFRKFFSAANPEHRWINPGFCVGPYVPLYGAGLCILYLLASWGESSGLWGSAWGRVLLLLCMALSMTAIEYLAGIVLLKWMKLRLWDYSQMWGNVQGLICPLFSAAWALLGAFYAFAIHPHILNALNWLANNLAFSFVIGFFFGVFTIDVAYSAQIVAKLKRYAEENQVVVKVENLKAHIRAAEERAHFLFAFRTEEHLLLDHLKEAYEAWEELREKRT